MRPDFTILTSATIDKDTVVQHILQMGTRCFPQQKFDRIPHLFTKVDDLFRGKIPPYQANDMAYHDAEHTLRVAYCWTQMFLSLHLHRKDRPVVYTDLLLGIAACLLHDSGYLKEQDDPYGTGAKFTLIHETRSCLIARRFLMAIGWPESAISVVQRLIAATGPRSLIDAIPFVSPTERTLGQMLATADFLAQIADPDYAAKLPALFAEFNEVDHQRGLNADERPFPDLAALLASTPDFWYHFVLPRLKDEYDSLYQLLNQPYPHGTNPYLLQAERNVRSLSSMIQSSASG
jgi:hypothetical protein